MSATELRTLVGAVAGRSRRWRVSCRVSRRFFSGRLSCREPADPDQADAGHEIFAVTRKQQ